MTPRNPKAIELWQTAKAICFDVDSTVIQDEGIQMTFEGVFNFDDEAATRPELTLRMDSPVRPLTLKWKPAAAGAYKLTSVE